MEMVGQRRVIASIFPMQLPPLLRPYGSVQRGHSPSESPGCTLYEIAKCAKRGDPPALLTITDAFQAEIEAMTRKSSSKRDIIQVEHIAKDLVTDHWTAPMFGAPGESGPGVWVCAGDAPTEGEIAAATARQRLYFEWLYATADRDAFQQKWTAIQSLHLEATRWLGHQPPWLAASEVKEQPRCQFCSTTVSPVAYLCPQCRSVIRPLPPEYFALQAQLLPQGAQAGPPRPPIAKTQ